MISLVNLDNYNNLSKKEIIDLIRYVDKDEKTIADLKNAESHPEDTNTKKKKKKRSGRKMGKEVSKILSTTTLSQNSVNNNKDEEGCPEGCFGCCEGKLSKNKTNSEKVAINQWAKKHCRSREEFFDLMVLTTKNVRSTLQGLRALKNILEYHDNPIAEVQKLSQIGGNIWLLTFAIQYLTDQNKTYPNLSNELNNIRTIYQNIGKYSQQFVILADEFFIKVDEMRNNCINIIKRLKQIYKIDGSPFDLRPEMFTKNHRHIRRCVNYGYEEGQKNESTFQIHWTPLNIAFKREDKDYWKSYASLTIEEKLSTFIIFANSELTFIETLMDEYRRSTHSTTNLTTEVFSSENETPVTSTLSEVTGAMLKYIMRNTSSQDKHANEIQLDEWRIFIEDFWVVVDLLYEVAYDLTILVQESRNIIRTCYMYTINFYHWTLSDFDIFDPSTNTKEFQENQRKAHLFIAKLLGHRRYTDAALFLSLADFTSSIYQEMIKNNEIEVGGMSLKLDSWDDENVETWGLVGGREDAIFKPKQGAEKS